MRNLGGRPSKGERDAILAKPPRPFGEILKHRAAEKGYSYGDYLVLLATEALDMPQYAPKAPQAQEPLRDVSVEAHTKAA